MRRTRLIKIIEKEAGYDNLQLASLLKAQLHIYHPGITIMVTGSGEAFKVMTVERKGITWFLLEKKDFKCYNCEPRRPETLWERFQTALKEEFIRWRDHRHIVETQPTFRTFQISTPNSRGLFH